MNSRTFLSAAILIVAAGSVGHAIAGDCDNVNLNPGTPRFAANSLVDVVIDTNELSVEGQQAVERAVSLLSGQVLGIKFQLVTQYDINRPNVNIELLDTRSPDDNRTANISYTPRSDGSLDTANVSIYGGQQGCSTAAVSLCFDETKPGYADAIYRSVVHELLHSLGASDSVVSATNGPNIMSPFTGVNTSGNQAWKVGCIVEKLPGLRGEPAQPRPPVCLL